MARSSYARIWRHSAVLPHYQVGRSLMYDAIRIQLAVRWPADTPITGFDRSLVMSRSQLRAQPEVVSLILCSAGIPLHDQHSSLTTEISSLSWTAEASSPTPSGHVRVPEIRVLFLVFDDNDRVQVPVHVLTNDDEEVAAEIEGNNGEAAEESMGDFKTVPAIVTSIEALDKVLVTNVGDLGRCGGSEAVDGDDGCVVCMDKFDVGLEVTRMPCSHVFHGECIVNWLQTSHLCPLCRYPMPTD